MLMLLIHDDEWGFLMNDSRLMIPNIIAVKNEKAKYLKFPTHEK